MIQRLRFATRRAGVDQAEFEAGLHRLATLALGEPPEVRPVRATVAVVVDEAADGPARHDGVLALWFADTDHLRRFEVLLAGTGAAGVAGEQFEAIAEVAASPAVVAETLPVRGEEWLHQRWVDGGPKLKHVALAQRAHGLTPSELSTRWRSHAGTAGSTVIPEAARGQAYVQDHPVPTSSREWDYDAITEVWFDDVVGLEQRIAWFTANQVGQQPDGLFRRSWFLALREQVILPR